MSHAHTICTDEMTNIMVTQSGSITVSYLINATHPYERMGKHILRDAYNCARYTIAYGTKPSKDRAHFHRMGFQSWRRTQ